MNICEAYKKKLAISEQVYAKEHGGKSLSETKKITIARVLANTSEYITEAFENSGATNLSNMGTFKKFCLDLTTVALPSLIANDLVIVYPMKSRTGYIQYLSFEAGTAKGEVAQGDVFNDVFRLGAMNEGRINYTAAAVVEAFTAAATPAAVSVAWSPLVKGIWENAGNKYDFKLIDVTTEGTETVTYGNFDNDGKIPASAQTASHKYRVAYQYDNVVLPQNDVPALTARMKEIALSAKARRIGIYYSQMAAFQAKTEMGIDLGEVLATQACGELSYEIDTEVVNMLDTAAGLSQVSFNKRCPWGVGTKDHYAKFAEVIEMGSQIIYDRTQKHAANYMICASNIKPILVMIDGFKAASTSKVNGPYFAGELNGIKVYVSPAIKAGRFVLGFNAGDFTTSAAVYAPYMAIVPTQLLGFADGGMTQGFSSLYDLKLLNGDLLVAGNVEDEEYIVQTHANA